MNEKIERREIEMKRAKRMESRKERERDKRRERRREKRVLLCKGMNALNSIKWRFL